ncbi:transposase [Gracilimonas sp. Q87]|uniref:transposase n=1 Tax=Gracilimonas sp. Q87 TaxID=3384766 RepID=UPI0039840A6D
MQNKGFRKYRSETVRLKSWDYGWNGVYFVTICTHNRKCYFGEVVRNLPDNVDSDNNIETQNLKSLRSNPGATNGSNQNAKMDLSNIGLIAETCWLNIPEHFPFVKLGEFVIMPNHVHGIIIIDKVDDGRRNTDINQAVETQNLAALRPGKRKSLNKFGPQSRNLASIIRGFKIGVTKNARKIKPDFKWQPKYHDHIVRGRKDYNQISEYIRNNPSKWANDKYHNQE